MDGDCIDKEVLVIFNDRRRPVKFKCFKNPSENYQSLCSAVEKAFCDILTAEEGSSNHSSESGFYLQMESNEWGGIIDVTPETRVDDHSTVFLCRQKSPNDYTGVGANASEKVRRYRYMYCVIVSYDTCVLIHIVSQYT